MQCLSTVYCSTAGQGPFHIDLRVYDCMFIIDYLSLLVTVKYRTSSKPLLLYFVSKCEIGQSLKIIYIYIISSKKRSLCTKICIYGFIFTNIPLKTNTELKLNVMPENIHLSFKSIYLSVLVEDYSRNVSYTLQLISTFLFSKFI